MMDDPWEHHIGPERSISMPRKLSIVSCFILLLAVVTALPQLVPRVPRNVSNSATSLTLLYQNNLNASDDINHVGALLLDPMPQVEAATACALYGETLLTKATLSAHKTDFIRSLSYQAFAGRALPLQPYYISGGVVVVAGAIEDLTFESFPARDVSLPVLCTQTSQESQPGNSSATSASEVIVVAKSNTFIGFRNQKSFRFLGIPYADEPERFHYSSLYSLTGQAIQATSYGSQCAQPSSGSEACHFLNIQTPYIPKVGSNADLRPVMFWIHGGGFTGGTGADPLSDGGNLASREDIVVVTFNYRLSTLGFLAIPGTNITGNFGIQDQTIALQVSCLSSELEIFLRVT